MTLFHKNPNFECVMQKVSELEFDGEVLTFGK